jgi:hypothetical protein
MIDPIRQAFCSRHVQSVLVLTAWARRSYKIDRVNKTLVLLFYCVKFPSYEKRVRWLSYSSLPSSAEYSIRRPGERVRVCDPGFLPGLMLSIPAKLDWMVSRSTAARHAPTHLPGPRKHLHEKCNLCGWLTSPLPGQSLASLQQSKYGKAEITESSFAGFAPRAPFQIWRFF